MPPLRTVLVIVLASAMAPAAYYVLFLGLSKLLSHQPPEWVDISASFALPVLSVVAGGFVAGVLTHDRWLPSSAAVGVLVSGFFAWIFADPMHAVIVGVVCAVCVPLSVLGGLIGSRSGRRVSIAP